MKGFIASLDAMLAIILITSLVTGSIYLLDNRQGVPWEDIYLQRIGMDVLTVLEKTGGVDSYVLNGDSELIQEISDMTPGSVCTKISFTEKGAAEAYYSYTKPGCSFGERQAVARRQALVYDENHALQQWVILKVQVWQK